MALRMALGSKFQKTGTKRWQLCLALQGATTRGFHQSALGLGTGHTRWTSSKLQATLKQAQMKNIGPLRNYHTAMQTSLLQRSKEMTEESTSDATNTGSSVAFSDFRTVLAETVPGSINEADRGPKYNDYLEGGEDEGDAFISQSGRMLLFPWKQLNGRDEILPDPQRGKMISGARKLPSVTDILQKTMSPESAMALMRWELFMIKKMGVPAFQKLKREMFSEGRQLHDIIGKVLKDNPEEVEIGKGIQGYWKSIESVLPELKGDDSTILECHVRHPVLGYHGYLDCITQYRGKLCVIEFKTSRKPKNDLAKCFDNPLQAVAYVGALNFDPRYQLQVDQALLVIAYKDGSPADVHVMTSDLCDLYWQRWLRRLQEYREIEGRRPQEMEAAQES
ncbi:mitochondrial genome maintenance exonuclease 1-like [Diadema setosum]|uniref:mitochondrial genome maintenance exonuclease 1-like n=1 Tax=Diadema setosum TaxID=31175 RepID=UPI003B3BB2BD